MLYPLLVSTMAGVSTALGAVIVILRKGISDDGMAFSQGFAAGVMLTVSLADIIPESFGKYYVYMNGINALKAVTSLFVAGWIMGWAVSGIATGERKYNNDRLVSAKRMAAVTTAVMILHNLPEGVLTFFTSAENTGMGLKMALAVALHNIPEGMAIAAPVWYASGSKLKAFAQAFGAGMAEPLGGVILFLIMHQYITPAFLNGIMPMVAGVMCQTAVCELIPNSMEISNIKHTLCGIISGISVMSIGLLLF